MPLIELELKKTITKNKAAKYLYEVIVNGKSVAQRRSNKVYVACYVTKWKNEDFYEAPYFFGRIDLIGKGDSRNFELVDTAYGIAYVKSD